MRKPIVPTIQCAVVWALTPVMFWFDDDFTFWYAIWGASLLGAIGIGGIWFVWWSENQTAGD